MKLTELAPRYIRDIAPYQPGKPIGELARELGLDEKNIIKLASNENPLGVSPRALTALQRALPELALYPDGSGHNLRVALAGKRGVMLEQIVLGNGSNDILEMVARTFLVPGDAAIYSQHAFAVYPLAVKAVGATGIEVPARQFGHDLEAMLAAITPAVKLVFVANPNNPTGTFIEGERLHQFLTRVPAQVLVVLDEAYTEYLPDNQRYDSAAWLAEFPNLIVSRTFSKAYGLAGLRIGYGMAHAEVVALLNRVRQPFNVNHLAQEAALAALDDTDFLARTVACNNQGMVQLTAALQARGLAWIPSSANFVSVRVGDAERIFKSLLQKGVIVRPIASYGMPEYLRISIGTAAENARFIEALDASLQG